MSQAKPPFIASPPASCELASCEGGFSTWWGKCASWRRRGNSPWRLAIWRGKVGVICGLIPFYNGFTGNLWRGLASLYIVVKARL